MPMWNGWGNDAANTRFQNEKAAGLTAAQVPKLTLKWAFGFPGVVVGVGPAVGRGRTGLRRQHQRHGVFARRQNRLHALDLQGRRRRAHGDQHRAPADRRRAAHARDVRRHPRQRLRHRRADRHAAVEDQGRRACRRPRHRRAGIRQRPAVRAGLVDRRSLGRARQLRVLHVPRQRGRARRRHRQADLEDRT